jgi:hypothetical protein
MKVLITKAVVLGILEPDGQHSTHGKPGQIVELSSSAGGNIVSVEKGIDVSKMDAKKVKELKDQIDEAIAAEAGAAPKAARVQNREPKPDNRDPAT